MHAPTPPLEKVTISFAAKAHRERFTLVLQDPCAPGTFGAYLSLNAKSTYSGVVQDGWILLETRDGILGLPLMRWEELLTEGVVVNTEEGEPYFSGV